MLRGRESLVGEPVIKEDQTFMPSYTNPAGAAEGEEREGAPPLASCIKVGITSVTCMSPGGPLGAPRLDRDSPAKEKRDDS